MIQYCSGTIFKSDAQVLVCPVSTVGVFGPGIGKAFKRHFPDMAEQYQKICRESSLEPGILILWKDEPHGKWVLDFPIKEDWAEKARLDMVEAGLQSFAETYQDCGIDSIAFPMLGVENKELKWRQVKPLMEKYLNNLPIDVLVYVS